MALMPCATASLMQVVCCWTSFLLSQTETSNPYFAAFFWYIFQEKPWDGLSICAMNMSLALPAAADGPAPVAAGPVAAGPPVAPGLEHAATAIIATESSAPARTTLLCIESPPLPLNGRGAPDVWVRTRLQTEQPSRGS